VASASLNIPAAAAAADDDDDDDGDVFVLLECALSLVYIWLCIASNIFYRMMYINIM